MDIKKKKRKTAGLSGSVLNDAPDYTGRINAEPNVKGFDIPTLPRYRDEGGAAAAAATTQTRNVGIANTWKLTDVEDIREPGERGMLTNTEISERINARNLDIEQVMSKELPKKFSTVRTLNALGRDPDAPNAMDVDNRRYARESIYREYDIPKLDVKPNPYRIQYNGEKPNTGAIGKADVMDYAKLTGKAVAPLAKSVGIGTAITAGIALVEGGIANTVNEKSKKPDANIGDLAGAYAKGVYGTLGEIIKPENLINLIPPISMINTVSDAIKAPAPPPNYRTGNPLTETLRLDKNVRFGEPNK